MTPFEGTVWAPDFSEEGFSKIRLSMNSDEVQRLIGEPIRESCGDGDCFWIYSWQDTGTADFDQRWVVFDNNDRVIEIRKSLLIKLRLPFYTFRCIL